MAAGRKVNFTRNNRARLCCVARLTEVAKKGRWSMIHRNEAHPQDGRKWTAIRYPSRKFIEDLDGKGYDIYITDDADGNPWVIYAMPLTNGDVP